MTSDFLQLKFYLFYRKVEICWNFCFSTVNSSTYVIYTNIHIFFKITKLKRKKKPLLMTVYVGLGKTFSPTRSFNFITSIKMQRKIQPNGMLCENSGVSMECNSLFISCAMHNNDHGSWTLYDVNSKKSMRQTVRRDGSPPISTTKYSYIIFLKKDLSDSICSFIRFVVGPCLHRGQGPLALGCLVPFAHGVAFLCFVWWSCFKLIWNVLKLFQSSSCSHKFHHVSQEIQSCAS